MIVCFIAMMIVVFSGAMICMASVAVCPARVSKCNNWQQCEDNADKRRSNQHSCLFHITSYNQPPVPEMGTGGFVCPRLLSQGNGSHPANAGTEQIQNQQANQEGYENDVHNQGEPEPAVLFGQEHIEMGHGAL